MIDVKSITPEEVLHLLHTLPTDCPFNNSLIDVSVIMADETIQRDYESSLLRISDILLKMFLVGITYAELHHDDMEVTNG